MSSSSPAPKTDEALALRVRDGSVDAFEELLSRHQARMFNFLCQKTGDRRDAEDLTQKVFVTAYRKIALFDPKHRFETWLYTIARRTAIDHYRHSSRRPALYGNEETVPEGVDEATPAKAVAAAEDKAELWKTIREQLNESQFTALWLRYEQDLPIAEIAVSMSKTVSNIKVLLHRSRERLAACLSSQQTGGEVPAVGERLAGVML